MQSIFRLLAGTIISIVVITVNSANNQNQKTYEWKGKLKDGTILTRDSLKQIVTAHKRWVLTQETQGQRALLDSADLIMADLRGVFLRHANLFMANLRGANLREADLLFTNLSGANLTEAKLFMADLRGANLEDATLRGAFLYKTVLDSANLNGANLYGAFLYNAVLDSANLKRANLENAHLNEAYLREANLYRAVLDSADLTEANLKWANLKDTTLRNARFRGANFMLTIFEPVPESIPRGRAFTAAKNLSKMQFIDTPDAMVALREEFKNAGMREQEMQVTFAIKHTQRIQAWEKGLFGKLESIFNLIFFELSCAYGMSPGRCLGLLGFLMLLSSIPYLVALKTKGAGEIKCLWKKREFRVKSRPSKLWQGLPKILKWIGLPIKWLRDIRVALYFSLLSAFHIGWRDLNVGNWITRIQSRDYTLGGVGWVRTVSGLQSLVSVYLLALWALTYFGRPFE